MANGKSNTEEFFDKYAEKIAEYPNESSLTLFSYYMDEYYGDELEALGANSDTIMDLYEYVKDGGMSDGSVTSELDMIYSLVSDSPAFESIQNSKAFKSFSKYKDAWDTYASDIWSLKQNLDIAEQNLVESDDVTRFTPEGAEAIKEATSSMLNISKNVTKVLPDGGITSEMLGLFNALFNDAYNLFSDGATTYDLAYFESHVLVEEYPQSIMNLITLIKQNGDPSDYPEDLPSLEEMSEFLSGNNDGHEVIFDAYLQWRFEYEANQAIARIEAETGIDMKQDTRTLWQKICDSFDEEGIVGAIKTIFNDYKDNWLVGKNSISNWFDNQFDKMFNYLDEKGIVDKLNEAYDSVDYFCREFPKSIADVLEDYKNNAEKLMIEFGETWYSGAEGFIDSWFDGKDMIVGAIKGLWGKVTKHYQDATVAQPPRD